MCISKEASSQMLIFGILSCVLLISFGIKSLFKYNLVLSISIAYVLLMQVIDWLIWSDIECNGWKNKLAGKLGPIFNYTQPLILLLVINIIFNKKISKFVILLNCIYGLSLIVYLFYYKKEQEKRKNPYCTFIDKETNHLVWPWDKLKIINAFYLIIVLINILLICDNYFIVLTILFIYAYLILISMGVKNKKSIGNLWCFIIPTIIIILLIIQHILPKLLTKKIKL